MKQCKCLSVNSRAYLWQALEIAIGATEERRAKTIVEYQEIYNLPGDYTLESRKEFIASSDATIGIYTETIDRYRDLQAQLNKMPEC